MVLIIDVSVKFRIFGITIGTVQKQFRLTVPQVALLFAEQVQSQLKMDERGVKIACRLEPQE